MSAISSDAREIPLSVLIFPRSSAGVLPSVLKRELDREGQMIDRSFPVAVVLPLEERGKMRRERGSSFLLLFTLLTLEDTLTFYEGSTITSQALPRADSNQKI